MKATTCNVKLGLHMPQSKSSVDSAWCEHACSHDRPSLLPSSHHLRLFVVHCYAVLNRASPANVGFMREPHPERWSHSSCLIAVSGGPKKRFEMPFMAVAQLLASNYAELKQDCTTSCQPQAAMWDICNAVLAVVIKVQQLEVAKQKFSINCCHNRQGEC
eukprot:6097497-Amphidinium_carterae.1